MQPLSIETDQNATGSGNGLDVTCFQACGVITPSTLESYQHISSTGGNVRSGVIVESKCCSRLPPAFTKTFSSFIIGNEYVQMNGHMPGLKEANRKLLSLALLPGAPVPCTQSVHLACSSTKKWSCAIVHIFMEVGRTFEGLMLQVGCKCLWVAILLLAHCSI